jgi:hypothetical protein
MLFITGEAAHSREFSEDAYKLAAEPKELASRLDREGLQAGYFRLSDLATRQLTGGNYARDDSPLFRSP